MYEETLRAQQDLAEVVAIIAADNPDAAERFLSLVKECYGALASTPTMGRERPELHQSLRSFPLHGNYVILYRPSASGGVLIIRFLHGARDIDKLL